MWDLITKGFGNLTKAIEPVTSSGAWNTLTQPDVLQGLAGMYGAKLGADATKRAADINARVADKALAYQKSRDAIEDKRFDTAEQKTAQQSDAMQEGFLWGFGDKKDKTTNGLAAYSAGAL